MKSNKTRGEYLLERFKSMLGGEEKGEPMEEIYVDVPPLKPKKMRELDVEMEDGKAVTRDMDEGMFERFKRMLGSDKAPEKVETEIVIKAGDGEPMPQKRPSSSGSADKGERAFMLELRALEDRLQAIKDSPFEKDKMMAEGLRKAIERAKKGK